SGFFITAQTKNRLFYLKSHLYTSFPLANNNRAIKRKKPTIWAYSKNLSLGLRPVTISYNRKVTCPPSRAGMGRMFKKANMMDIKAVVDQKAGQFHESGKRLPMAPKPPTPL